MEFDLQILQILIRIIDFYIDKYINSIDEESDYIMDSHLDLTIVDNHKIHKSKDNYQYYNENQLVVLHIVQYMPEFQPIEEVFSIVKNNYTDINDIYYENTLKYMQQSIDRIQLTIIQKIFVHMFGVMIGLTKQAIENVRQKL